MDLDHATELHLVKSMVDLHEASCRLVGGGSRVARCEGRYDSKNRAGIHEHRVIVSQFGRW